MKESWKWMKDLLVIWQQYWQVKKKWKYCKSISNNALMMLNDALERSDVKDLFKTVKRYCSIKLESRLKKLKDDIEGSQNRHILSFKEFG
ncbi:14538_t:CDS:2 [Funneliformis mosseae]|uniref:14538_t:CDS:1 n=1 Tax=Funneliformis mosseae TaxID=27381 RepID=A0A9N9HC20_FUNMO|nr:14538_t:CDS:2 [Funneliformis mosseae]